MCDYGGFDHDDGDDPLIPASRTERVIFAVALAAALAVAFVLGVSAGMAIG